MDFMYIFWVVGRVFFQDVTIGSFASSLQPPTHLLLSFFSLFSLFFSLRNHKKNFEKGKKRKMSDKIRDRDMANLKSRGLKWIPDPETQVCMSCKDEFGLLNRRVSSLLFSFSPLFLFSSLLPSTPTKRDNFLRFFF